MHHVFSAVTYLLPVVNQSQCLYKNPVISRYADVYINKPIQTKSQDKIYA